MASRAVYLGEGGRVVVGQLSAERCFRPPAAHDSVIDSVLRETGFDFSEARARAGFGRGHLLDVVVYSRSVAQADLAYAREAAALVVEGLLGERCYEQWIDSVEIALLSRVSSLPVLQNPSDAARSFPLAELPAAVSSAVERLLHGLPDRNCLSQIEDATWTMFELEPEAAPDYAAQDDLVLATSTQPEMLKCYLRGAPFDSSRFSRHGEVFCYLKLEDTPSPSAEERLERRRALEDALNARLVPAGLGCVVGNGLGIRYSYVDLALTELAPAVEGVREVAQLQQAPQRSWLLFCDSGWSAEWIGIWDDALPPPAA